MIRIPDVEVVGEVIVGFTHERSGVDPGRFFILSLEKTNRM